jgi:hypothetical protein
MYDHQVRLELLNDRRRREFREAADNRLLSRANAGRHRRPFRSAVGHSLVRLGNALASESDPVREPARSR